MFTPTKQDYPTLLETLPYQLNPHDAWVTTLSNAAAHLKYYMSDVNWLGFYLWHQDKLVLGPFQGLPACTEIALERGVCGTVAKTKEALIVDDVHAFPGHIFCDGDSKSEMVLPMIKDGRFLGVLDIDSPIEARFKKEDLEALQKALAVVLDNLSLVGYNL